MVCRERQQERFKSQQHITCNANMSTRDVQKFCALDSTASDMLKMAMTELNFSARAYNRIIKVARTIADIADTEAITAEHIAEAIQYRSLDRNMWV
jgi:magnesium chelatase family protein